MVCYNREKINSKSIQKENTLLNHEGLSKICAVFFYDVEWSVRRICALKTEGICWENPIKALHNEVNRIYKSGHCRDLVERKCLAMCSM